MSKASCLVKLGREEEALLLYDTALRLNPLSAPTLHNKGVTLEQMGKTAEAQRLYRKVVALHPEYVPAQQALDRLQMGSE